MGKPIIRIALFAALTIALDAGGASAQTAIGEPSLDVLPTGSVVPTSLTLQVDPTTGHTVLKNATEAAVSMTGYRIASASATLSVDGWDPISNGNELPEEFPPDNGVDDGLDWEMAPNASSNELEEWYLTGASTLNVGQQLFLGSAVNPAGMPSLEFTYSLSDETIATGNVIYEAVPVIAPTGDYNNNGVVDAADYVAWRENLNQLVTLPNDSTPGEVSTEDYYVWRENFGQTAIPSGAALGSGKPVPEPGTVGLLALAALASWARVGGRRVRRGAARRLLASD